MSPFPVEIFPLGEVPEDAVETLLDEAFGRDRRSLTAYRVRVGTTAIAPLCFAARIAGRLVGVLESWPVVLLGDDGRPIAPMVMVGPVGVAPAAQNSGVGRSLMMALIEGADRTYAPALMMVGDPEYYARFGFEAALAKGWTLPGPFEPRRLLARATRLGAVPQASGIIGPWS